MSSSVPSPWPLCSLHFYSLFPCQKKLHQKTLDYFFSKTNKQKKKPTSSFLSLAPPKVREEMDGKNSSNSVRPLLKEVRLCVPTSHFVLQQQIGFYTESGKGQRCHNKEGSEVTWAKNWRRWNCDDARIWICCLVQFTWESESPSVLSAPRCVIFKPHLRPLYPSN